MVAASVGEKDNCGTLELGCDGRGQECVSTLGQEWGGGGDPCPPCLYSVWWDRGELTCCPPPSGARHGRVSPEQLGQHLCRPSR